MVNTKEARNTLTAMLVMDGIKAMDIESMRKEFEARFHVPDGVVFTPGFGYSAYFADNETLILAGNVHEARWRVWQSAKEQAVPEGWQLVPKEPTAEMCHASTTIAPTWDDEVSAQKYKAMLAAAPEAA